MKKIAITGGIGSGKSTVARYIGEQAFPVFSCDEIYKKLYNTPKYQSELREAFPFCAVDGRVDKALLSDLVFNDPQALCKLNALAHTRIMQSLEEHMDKAAEPIVFAEVPLLFEGNYETLFDAVIVVLRDREQRIASILARDNVDRNTAEKRLSNQLDYDDPIRINDFSQKGYFLIKNNSTQDELQKNLNAILLPIINKMKQ